MCKCSFVWWASALVLVGVLVGALEADEAVRGDARIIFDNSDVIVNPGQPLHLDCGLAGGSLRLCTWENEKKQTHENIIQTQDVQDGLVSGYSKAENTNGNNDCGIIINSVTTEDHGTWVCKIMAVGTSLSDRKKVIVTIKPTAPTLEVDTKRPVQVATDEEVNVKCSVAAARPAASIRWYLGERDITLSANSEETPTDDKGTFKTVSTLKRFFDPSDNGQELKCSVEHYTLPLPEVARVLVDVRYRPLEKPPTTFYKIPLHEEYNVRFNFTANPAPSRIEWQVGDSFETPALSIPVPGAMDQYTTTLEGGHNGHFMAHLRLASFTKEDSAKRYKLVVDNDLGSTEYKVSLSTEEAPLDERTDSGSRDLSPFDNFESDVIVVDDEMPSNALTSGGIAGIVIVLLVVIVVVIITGYFRYHNMYCFGGAAVGHEEQKEVGQFVTEEANNQTSAPKKKFFTKFEKLFKAKKETQEMNLEKMEEGTTENQSLTKKDDVAKEQRKEESPLADKPYLEEYDNDKRMIIRVKSIDNEVVYAELDLIKGDKEKKEVKVDEKTEYAEIVGVVTDNKDEEKKE